MAATFAAFSASARDLPLAMPLDCTLGDTCFIQNYMDQDPGPGAADFTCNALTYDGHKGTDIALTSMGAMEAGVNVMAAAPGTVIGRRDGMPDILAGSPGAPSLDGRECGNGVVIDHGDGWQTQYCHMKQGSIAVENGRRVALGTVLGQVGLSGQTEFPHLELSVRRNGQPVDPFDPDGIVTCNAPPDQPLWTDPVSYVPGGIVSVGIADGVPEFDAIKAGLPTAASMPATAPALVIWGQTFGTRQGDEMQLVLAGPSGTVAEQTVTLDRNQARAFRAAGRKLRGTWPPGEYTGTVTLIRDGAEIGRQMVTVAVGN